MTTSLNHSGGRARAVHPARRLEEDKRDRPLKGSAKDRFIGCAIPHLRRRGATIKREISRTLLSINLHFLLHESPIV